MSIFSLLFGGKAPKQPAQIVEGSRLDPESLFIQDSAYGKNIIRIFGRARTAGNVIWARDIREVRTESTSTTSTGSGKTKVSATTTNIEYTYFGTFAIAICAGEISDILKIWADTKVIYNIDTTDADTLAQSAALPIVKYLGSETQTPSSIMESYEGAGNVPGYRGLAYVVFNDLPLKDFANRIPNFSFEVQA